MSDAALQIHASLEIHFYQEDQVAVVSSSADGADGQMGDYLIFCLFAIRQIVNLGVGSAAATSVADALRHFGANFDECLSKQYGPSLVEARGQGAKQFRATLNYTAWPPNFQMEATGFGFFARRIDQYARAAVIALLRHLALRRRGNPGFHAGLRLAASGCAILYHKGEISMASQATTAIALAMPAFNESAAVHARTPLETEEEEARDFGAIVDREGFLSTFSAIPSALQFWSLDRATRMVFHRIVQEQADILSKGDAPQSATDRERLSMEVGKAVFDGYILGRRLWQTHDKAISFSRDETEAQSHGQRMLKELQSVRASDILTAAGEHVTKFVGDWVVTYAQEGVYGELPDRNIAEDLLLITILNGFGLSVVERRVSGYQ